MPQKLLQRLFPRARVRRRRGKRYLIVDFRDEHIQLPDGSVIPRSKILNIDTVNKKIIFIDERGQVREASYGPEVLVRRPEELKKEEKKQQHTAPMVM